MPAGIEGIIFVFGCVLAMGVNSKAFEKLNLRSSIIQASTVRHSCVMTAGLWLNRSVLAYPHPMEAVIHG